MSVSRAIPGAARLDGSEHHRDAKDQKDVGGVRADDIAHCDVRKPGKACLQGHEEFGHGGAEADDRQADEQGREAQPRGEHERAAHERVAPCDEKDESKGDEPDIVKHGMGPPSPARMAGGGK